MKKGMAAKGNPLTPRGEFLVAQNLKSQGSLRPKCGCGYHVRGPNHETGQHHQKGRKVS